MNKTLLEAVPLAMANGAKGIGLNKILRAGLARKGRGVYTLINVERPNKLVRLYTDRDFVNLGLERSSPGNPDIGYFYKRTDIDDQAVGAVLVSVRFSWLHRIAVAYTQRFAIAGAVQHVFVSQEADILGTYITEVPSLTPAGSAENFVRDMLYNAHWY